MSDPIWRLLLDGRVEGAENMAVDSAVLGAVGARRSLPTLRLYGWEVPTVTLGRFQPVEQVDRGACAGRGFDIVRRPTGGRGVLHDDELTYSVVAGVDDGVPKGITASYRYLSEALAEAYRVLGVPAEITARQRGAKGSAACYLHATHADLSLGAAKLSGSAQVWKGDAVLQHGSFIVSRDSEAEAEVFRLAGAQAVDLDRTTATLEAVLGRRPSVGEMVAAVTGAFARVLGVTLEAGELSGTEREAASIASGAYRIQSVPRCGAPGLTAPG